MLRRVMIAVAALLAALSLSAGPANAGVGDVELYPNANYTGTPQLIAGTSLSQSSCTAVTLGSGAFSAKNRTTFQVVGLYTTQSNCTNNIPFATLTPGSSLGNFGSAVWWVKEIPSLGMFENASFGGAKQFVLESALSTSCAAVDTSAIASGQVRSVSNRTSQDVIFYGALNSNCTTSLVATVLANSTNSSLSSPATHFKI